MGLALTYVFVVGEPVAQAHPTRQFNACAAITQNGARCFPNGLSYHYGSPVRLRAKVTPVHSPRAGVWMKRPGEQSFSWIGHAPIDAQGRMRFNWPTTRDDADQNRPYHFEFRIPGHGRSTDVDVWVLFGE
jgi:hypothetical protein